MMRADEVFVSAARPGRDPRGRRSGGRRWRPTDTEPRRGRSRDAFETRRPPSRRRRADARHSADADRMLIDTRGGRVRSHPAPPDHPSAAGSVSYIESAVEYEAIEPVRIKRSFVASDGTLATMWLGVEQADLEPPAEPAAEPAAEPVRSRRLWARVQAAAAARQRRAANIEARRNGASLGPLLGRSRSRSRL